MERPGSSQDGESSKRPTSLAIGSHLDNYLARQEQSLRNCRKKLESTQKESKMLDLQITEYQLKIQRIKDNIHLHAMDTRKLHEEIEEQKQEKNTKSGLLREMSQQMSPSGGDASPVEHWACPRCSNINELVAMFCSHCGFVPQDIASLILVLNQELPALLPRQTTTRLSTRRARTTTTETAETSNDINYEDYDPTDTHNRCN